MNMSEVNLDLEFEYARPWLYPLQSQAMFGPQDVSGALARMSMIEASTKSGKTVSAMAWILEQALQGADGNNYWWVALSGSGAIHGTAGKSPSGFKGIREFVWVQSPISSGSVVLLSEATRATLASFGAPLTPLQRWAPETGCQRRLARRPDANRPSTRTASPSRVASVARS